MAPKKKGNKGGQEDWEAELGESIPPAASTSNSPPVDAEDNEDDAGGSGGLMAMLKKNKEKRKKKGLHEDDPVPGEDPSGSAPAADETSKAPEEASMQEFALPNKKGKDGGKARQAAKKDQSEDVDEGGKILTKAEKEKLKKEREKQRKREQVCPTEPSVQSILIAFSPRSVGRQKEDPGAYQGC